MRLVHFFFQIVEKILESDLYIKNFFQENVLNSSVLRKNNNKKPQID